MPAWDLSSWEGRCWRCSWRPPTASVTTALMAATFRTENRPLRATRKPFCRNAARTKPRAVGRSGCRRYSSQLTERYPSPSRKRKDAAIGRSSRSRAVGLQYRETWCSSRIGWLATMEQKAGHLARAIDEVNDRRASIAWDLGKVPLTLDRISPGWLDAETAAKRMRLVGRNSMARMPSGGMRHSICARPLGLMPISGSDSDRSAVRKATSAFNDSMAMEGSSGSFLARACRYLSRSAVWSKPDTRRRRRTSSGEVAPATIDSQRRGAGNAM